MHFLDRLFDRDDDESELKKLRKKILKLAENEIRVTYNKADAPLSACESRIGGRPAVPADFVWPEYSGTAYGDEEAVSRPLSFMAQINLKDISKYDTKGVLPNKGILSFFYELVTMQWGFDPSDRGAARVYYFPEEDKLTLRDIPDFFEEDVVIPEFAVSFEKHISLPCYESCPKELDCDCDDYDECCEELGYEYDDMGDVTKLLGYPDVIQSPMEEECEAVTRGYRQGNPADYAKVSEAERNDIREKAKEWKLLFQMGTIEDDGYELMFGDCGHIYFWIKESDLKACNFENIWLVLQCG